MCYLISKDLENVIIDQQADSLATSDINSLNLYQFIHSSDNIVLHSIVAQC